MRYWSRSAFAITRFAASCGINAGFSGYIHEWLVRGSVDLACLHNPVPQPGFTSVPLVKEEVFLVGRSDTLHSRREPGRRTWQGCH
jgi:DNA-binding transcriptional LysR family regulator